MKIGILFSKIRVEEKLLIEEVKKRRNVTLKLIDSRKLIITPEDDLGIDVLLDREIASSKALHVVEMLKNSAVRCINSYDVIRICGDKVFTSRWLSKKGVPTPKVKVAFTKESALEAIEEMGYPVVLKPVDGSWGRLIAKIENKNSALAILEHKSYLSSFYHSIFYLQEYINKPDRDIRVLMIDEEPICASYRKSSDWLTNVSKGATTEECIITPELEKISIMASKAVGGGALAIDIMETADGFTVNEINCSMEFKGSMHAVKKNIPSIIIDYCLKD
ncbi:MAG: lysine biosynthesis protein LysX [Candidatus Marinimicrobia bacterium]|nr:lysine biosynthesis protein LysX [Candidatus Neomarinimicrobiota bacterium]OUW50895.1 MAG: lysine biosynthesis protein LysX [bacterium TMED190]